jgi:hypothetical protein
LPSRRATLLILSSPSLNQSPLGLVPQKTARQGHHTGLSFGHLLERFKTVFPAGFEDPAFEADERRYKEDAVANFLVKLGREEMSILMAAEKYDEIAARAKQCASHKKMNLIFPQELMGLSDALKPPEAQREFSLALFDVLYGEGDPSNGF